MQDIRKKSSPFGGLTVLLAGDWRQILPVVLHGSRPDIVDATLKSSYLWQIVTRLQLTQNIGQRYEESFHNLQISFLALRWKRRTPQRQMTFFIKLPDDMTVENEKELLDFVFGGIENNYTDSAWLSSRSTMCPTNSKVDAINNTIMSIFPVDVKVYRSNDSVEENEHQYPIEFLNTLCPSGMRPHTLQLRKHNIKMLLRNLDPVKGHCNGTGYVIYYLHDHIIDATIACGPRAGKQIFIPLRQHIPFPHEKKAISCSTCLCHHFQ